MPLSGPRFGLKLDQGLSWFLALLLSGLSPDPPALHMIPQALIFGAQGVFVLDTAILASRGFEGL